MKLLLSLAVLFFVPLSLLSQNDFTINGTTYSLKTEVVGPISLHWNTFDGQYRYFAEKDGNFIELVNTRQQGKFQHDYRQALSDLTSDQTMDVSGVNLTLGSLGNFFEKYNTRVDPSYKIQRESVALTLRLGGFAGISNSIYTENLTNELLPVAGIELELLDEVKLRRHAMVLRFAQTFQNDAFQYSSSQFSLNYRFKFVKTPWLDIYANAKFVAYTYASRDGVERVDPDTLIVTETSTSGGDFTSPASFGIGADIKLGNGFLFLTYNDIVALGVDDNGEFPVDLSLGYKFNL
ncbi:MAG: hypothetical protein CMC08_03250 [Flavobacteriaceae bacterium]|nr:hypothetical protein [Flavobacteriaceae bacterium]